MTVEHTFAVSGMHCASCGLLIDDALEDLAGVERAQTSLRTGVTTVRLDPAVITPAEVAETIRSTGYGAALKAPED